MGYGRRRLGLPALRLVGPDLRPAIPRRAARRLAARMGDLHRDLDRRMGAHRLQHAAQRRFVLVRVQAEVVGCDASLRRDRGRFENQRAGAGQREVAQMDQVPVGGIALLRRVLAHRRDQDAVVELQIADLQRGKQCGHREPLLCSGGYRLAVAGHAGQTSQAGIVRQLGDCCRRRGTARMDACWCETHRSWCGASRRWCPRLVSARFRRGDTRNRRGDPENPMAYHLLWQCRRLFPTQEPCQ